ADIEKLLDVLNRLVEAGDTVLVIEHNLDVIKTADYIIDLGPEGGDGGGTVVATGTPEEVAAVPGSYTGQFLKPLLNAGAAVGAVCEPAGPLGPARPGRRSGASRRGAGGGLTVAAR